MGKTRHKFTKAVTSKPVVIKRLILLRSARKPFVNFSKGVSKEQYRTDNSQFRFGENSFIYDGLLHDIQAKTTNIVHAVTESG